MKRKWLLIVAAALLATTALSAKPREVKFWTLFTGGDGEFFDAMVKAYNASQSDVVMDEVAASLSEPDVLCLGDFNADGSYYSETGSTETAARAAFVSGGASTSTSSSGKTSSWLAGFSPDRYETLIPNGVDTTVASGTSYTYDRMEISAAMEGDYDGSWGVLKPGELWDLSACEGGKESSGGERSLSDHYPVWAEFSTTKDSD